MKIKKLLKSNSGATIVELLISFAIFFVMLSCVTMLISSSSNIFLRVKYLSYANSVGDMIMERVSGEIASATGEVIIDNTDTELNNDTGNKISFTDNAASPLYIGLNDENRVHIYYREVRVIEEDKYTGTEEILWPAVDWTFDEKAYQQFTVKTLEFTGITDNAVHIKLVLSTPFSNLEYESIKVVECYNMDGIAEKVQFGEVYLTDDAYYQHKYN